MPDWKKHLLLALGTIAVTVVVGMAVILWARYTHKNFEILEEPNGAPSFSTLTIGKVGPTISVPEGMCWMESGQIKMSGGLTRDDCIAEILGTLREKDCARKNSCERGKI